MIDKNSEEFTYLMQLVFAVDANDTRSVEDAFNNLDDLGVSFRIQNDVVAWAETYGAGRKDTSRVASELEDMLYDYGY
jgi:hypothetical protein|tara:strand:+ start:432 stop:665 length:234 start_codon:yes stop_codon:yes gene_type:complete